MSVVSPQFYAFVVAVLALYYLLPRPAQIPLLVAASYVFYATWSWKFCVVLFVLSVFNFAWGRHLASARRPDARRLWIGIGVNVLALAVCKYGGPSAALAALGWPGADQARTLALPVGLSFYILGAIAYLVDVHRRQAPPAERFVDFALFMAYFPKLLLGPIERARTFLPQLASARVVGNTAIAQGVTLIVIGLVRKLVVADEIARLMPEAVTRDPASVGGLTLWVWLIAIVVQIYADFAGYTDIMRGISTLFGIQLSVNFRAPFFSRSFMELFTRWHASLSFWLRDYVYFPLARRLLRRNPSAPGLAALVIPPILTMLVSGLWHGASSPGYLVWGALVGLCLAGERLATRHRPARPAPPPAWTDVPRMLVVFAAWALATVPFRLELPGALGFWAAMLKPGWSSVSPLVPMLLVLSLWLDWSQWRADDECVFVRWPRVVRAGLLALALLAIGLSSLAGRAEVFVYQAF